MSRADQGRIPIVDPLNPQCWARDDLTGLPVMHTDMVKYYEYLGGRGLVWTGFLSHQKDVDQPNPQLCPPMLRPDPVPIDNPRYLSLPVAPDVPIGLTITNITPTTAEFSWIEIPLVPSYSIVYEAPWSTTEVTVSSSPYVLTNLIPNSTYSIQVASINSVCQSAYSNPISFTTT